MPEARKGATIVTGGSGGIGAAVARLLAARGHRVVVHGNSNPAAAQAVVDDIVGAGGEAMAVSADVTDAAQVEAMVGAVVERFGSVDALVNNAGVCKAMAVGEMSAAAVNRELSVNVASVVLMTQACLPHMGEGAAIVNLGSNLAVAPLPGLTLYCATKAAVASLTQGFARELGGRKIRVNAVAPGATRTAMTAWIDDDTMDGIAGQTPLSRVAEPEDIAGAVAMLLSGDAGWVTGRTLVVDGGLV
ncbi:SDR family NAD(P)-dependent oxidoreductase [Novosphingobium sp. PP1Y]|uniref:SDR family NAD(P)-dependent oxidoreductase n=1 Tax=Novosphingobium sp. PP1Y TaxID=702113 RepID=UPI00020EEA66|nr:glucose 1-dehydrogenase [Novosphingobium sp. PP1Y]CCA91976.1 3-oxoacyl-[acyl-carrier protein] reductase [Novosphingobium sp. PP1Y]